MQPQHVSISWDKLCKYSLKFISVSYYSLQPYLPVTQQSFQASQARQSCSIQMYAGVKYKITYKLPVMWCGFILDTAATGTPVIMDEIVPFMLRWEHKSMRYYDLALS